MAIIISRIFRNPHSVTPACNIPIVPYYSCFDKRGIINKVIELRLQCFIHVYIRASCEMVKYFASLIRGTPRAKHGKTVMHGWWWPVS